MSRRPGESVIRFKGNDLFEFGVVTCGASASPRHTTRKVCRATLRFLPTTPHQSGPMVARSERTRRCVRHTHSGRETRMYCSIVTPTQ